MDKIREALEAVNRYINDGSPLPPAGDPYYEVDRLVNEARAALSRLAAKEGQDAFTRGQEDARFRYEAEGVSQRKRADGLSATVKGLCEYIDKQEGIYRQIIAAAGNPDPSEACRVIIGLAQEAIEPAYPATSEKHICVSCIHNGKDECSDWKYAKPVATCADFATSEKLEEER